MILGKRIALALGGAASTFGLFWLAETAGFGSGYSLLAPDAVADGERAVALDREPFRLEPFSEFGEVLARPVFNESRAPEAVPESGATAEGEAAEPTASPLNVTLTGVIITPTLKLAMVRDNAGGALQRVRVGHPLEGEQSGWTLVELRPRGAVFEGAGLGRQELELAVDAKGAPPPAPPVAAAPEEPKAEAAPDGAQPIVRSTIEGRPSTASADEIRRRIEERRRQLREEAQRMMQQEQQDKQ